MTELKLLKQRRARVKGQATRIQNYLDSIESPSIADARVRLQRLQELWNQFEEIQTEIKSKSESEDEKSNKEAQESEERTLFENCYYKAAAKAQAVIEADTKQQAQAQIQAAIRTEEGTRNGNAALDNRRQEDRRTRLKLPEIKLPEFKGEYTKWIFFKNSFETIIHNDVFLTPMQKHQYLIGVLQGEARQVIQGFNISGDNYENAWKLLKDTYDNQMMIIETHLDEMLDFPAITKENKAESIRKFVWHIHTHTKSLEALHQPVDQWDTIILHMAKKKLDFAEQKDWQNIVKDKSPRDMPKLEEFLKFLTERCHSLRVLNQGKEKVANIKKTAKKEMKKVNLVAIAGNCAICEGSHSTYRCEELLKGSNQERMALVKEKRLCINCLVPGHYAASCKSSMCKKCSKRHNTILHRNDDNVKKDSETTEKPMVNHCAEIPARKSMGTTNKEESGKASERSISGISQSHANVSKVATVRIKSIYTKLSTNIECLILKSITEKLPQKSIEVEKLDIPRDVRLADSDFHKPSDIDLLIGAELYWQLVLGAPRGHKAGHPVLQNTRLGWIIGGEMQDIQNAAMATCLKVTNDMLSKQVEQFWIQESVLEGECLSEEERICERHFTDTVVRDSIGRFVVRLPIRPDVILGSNREQAFKRFLAAERRLSKNPALKREYGQFMKEYIHQGHMSPIGSEGAASKSEEYILPHQAIMRPESATTKLRVVFDASARTDHGVSLNDKLMTGPNLQRDLIDIIFRFRVHKYVITADVAMMFRQIVVDKRDRIYQRIFWRHDSTETLQVYELNTVTYGTACAPYLAVRCIRQLAKSDGADLPHAAKVIEEDCYMDDVLTGSSTIEEARDLQKQLSELLSRGQFHLRKWRTNEPRILQHLTEECKTDQWLVLDKEDPVKTLGLYWNSALDCLQYQVRTIEECAATKRAVLSRIAQVFDPLGLIAPLLIRGKMIMQRLWTYDIEWDEVIPEDLATTWSDCLMDLQGLKEIWIPRRIISGNDGQFDIYGFGDASEKAYGACLYGVSEDEEGNLQSRLIIAKSRVAPLKKITLPRLELEAALLLSRLYKLSRKAYGERIRTVKLWTDSTIVLGWLKHQPNELRTFVGNRVAKIHDLTQSVSWLHVPSEENPADALSRGTSSDLLENSQLWWSGPSWITGKFQYPAKMADPEDDVPELKSSTLTLTVTEFSTLRKFSEYEKLLRVIAYCMRFKDNTIGMRKVGAITVGERQYAETTVIRMVQKETFIDEISELTRKRELSRRSPLRALDPYIDDEGVMRVGGRLRHADLLTEQKHPIILPAKHHVTTLIMRDAHKKLHHCPPGQLLSVVRLRFWPLNGRREARKIVTNCVSCFRSRPKAPEVKMGDLPRQRVSGFSRPFVSTGVDYAGPLQVKESRRRGRVHVSKGYIAVFICLSTKAVHLEMVSDLTTEAFLAALSRFTARRGICSELFSDNGTNFTGAARELKEVYALLERHRREIEDQLARQRIIWKFIPPRAPHFGGLWEAAVKMTKRHLFTVTKGKLCTFEEYSTLLAGIEAVLNSRPLFPLSDDPSDLSVLTPAHFLVGDTLIQPVQLDHLQIPDNRLSRWQHIQKLRQEFWKRWSSEYLQELQRRNKWSSQGDNIKVDMLVLVIEDHMPPLQWALGRIIEVFPGPDGLVRVAAVKTSSGVFRRPIRKLCPLPIDNDMQLTTASIEEETID